MKRRCRITGTWKQPRCATTEEWIKKMEYIYTVMYYSAVKNKDIMKFEGKLKELEYNHPDERDQVTRRAQGDGEAQIYLEQENKRDFMDGLQMRFKWSNVIPVAKKNDKPAGKTHHYLTGRMFNYYRT
ncbi:hypothetical protein STEG23_000744 [Scotinomys teguina]